MITFEVCQFCGKLPVDPNLKVWDDRGRMFCTQEHADQQFLADMDDSTDEVLGEWLDGGAA